MSNESKANPWLLDDDEAMRALFPAGNRENSSLPIDVTPEVTPVISPLVSGTYAAAAISEKARKNALEFAHPVDSKIIKALDDPTTNAIIGKVVQASIDAGQGLVLASGVHVTKYNFPDIYAILESCANRLGIPVPYMVLSDEVHGINAYTAGTDQFAYIVLGAFVPVIMNANEMKFIIGHECGHLALGHVLYHTAGNLLGTTVGIFGSTIPIVGPLMNQAISLPLKAWSRRSEISADRAGLLCCGDIEVAKKALFRLTVGMLNIDNNVDIDKYVAESEKILSGSSLGVIGEYTLAHPIIPKRIKALQYFANSDCYRRCGGSVPISYPLDDKQLYDRTEEILAVVK